MLNRVPWGPVSLGRERSGDQEKPSSMNFDNQEMK